LLLICKNNVAAVAPLSNKRLILIRLNIKLRTQAVFILILLLPALALWAAGLEIMLIS